MAERRLKKRRRRGGGGRRRRRRETAEIRRDRGATEMMRMRRSGSDDGSSRGSAEEAAAGAREVGGEWEMRPGGMLVQRRGWDPGAPPPEMRLRISYGAARFEVSVCSLATFRKSRRHCYLRRIRLPLLLFSVSL